MQAVFVKQDNSICPNTTTIEAELTFVLVPIVEDLSKNTNIFSFKKKIQTPETIVWIATLINAECCKCDISAIYIDSALVSRPGREFLFGSVG